MSGFHLCTNNLKDKPSCPRRQTSAKDDSRLLGDVKIRNTLYTVVFLHWLCFIVIELHCHLLEFKMCGVVDLRFLPKPNSGKTKFTALTPDLTLLHILMVFLGPCCTPAPRFMEIRLEVFELIG